MMRNGAQPQRRIPAGEHYGLFGYQPVECPRPGCGRFWFAAKPGTIGPEGVQHLCARHSGGCGALFVVSYPSTGLIIRMITERVRR